MDHPDFISVVEEDMKKQALQGLRYFAACAGIRGEITCELMDDGIASKFKIMGVGVSLRGKQRLKDCFSGMVIANRYLE
jgi:hypothetical protein